MAASPRLLETSPLGTEVNLLELFAPSRSKQRRRAIDAAADSSALWRTDAMHRAKNLAQLSRSLANIVEHPSRDWLPVEAVAQARALSLIYEELGLETRRSATACANVLTEMVTCLMALFGRARQIRSVILVEPFRLPTERRRALTLMCSELVINALKYGFPGGGGKITVALRADRCSVELVVEDDGMGLVGAYVPGQGGGLLEQLRAILDATIVRSPSHGDLGFRVSVCVPSTAPRKIPATGNTVAVRQIA